ncbi:MAG TPA: DUF3109 family protein [Ignavibacteria bacterium]|nr:DUF3109 family protein [Ignavibacteria bacterium]
MLIPQLEKNGIKVDDSIFNQGFVAGCDMNICFGQCCCSGVYMDKEFKNVILQHTDDIISNMSNDQIKNPEEWFDDEIEEDSDFPSGFAIGSAVYTDSKGTEKCVFNDENNYCTLQVTAVKKNMHKWDIKPTHCIMYPVTVVDNTLQYDDVHSLDMDYCGKHKTENFTQTVFDATKEEIKYVLGEEFFDILFDYYKKNYSPKFNIQVQL